MKVIMIPLEKNTLTKSTKKTIFVVLVVTIIAVVSLNVANYFVPFFL